MMQLAHPLTATMLFCTALGVGVSAAPPDTRLAAGGQAALPVVVNPDATDAVRLYADELAGMLSRISGAEFRVVDGDGSRGIAVGVHTDFPGIEHGAAFTSDDPFRRDDYLLRTHPGGVVILGAGELAVRLGVWDFLHRLGYRLYFLTDTWEVVPRIADLTVAVDAFEHPDFITRDAPRRAPWSDNELWNRWRLRNRIASSFRLSTGHSYGAMIRANAEAFRTHPEFYALVDGERRLAGEVDGRGNIKFCIGNPDLRKLIVEHAARQMRENPDMDSISMDPSDGGNWCECDACAALGTVSDRAVTLANEVAEAINALGLGTRTVGMYAYNQHSPPPTIRVHPNVVISIATSFIRGGYTLDELIGGWRGQGATLGIRDYHDVFAWSHDLPRKARGGKLDYLCTAIPGFHAKGARFMNSENADSWGANGLGYWITPRLLWDVDTADHVDALVEDFVTNAFGDAVEPMRAFYDLLNQDTTIRSSEDLVARLYRSLRKAYSRSRDPAVHARLDDLVLYVRYLELYYAYRLADGDARQQGFEAVWRHTYRMKDRMMLSTVAICHRDRFRDKAVSVPDAAAWTVPEADNPWKDSTPFSAEEIKALLDAGIDANQPTELDFTPRKFGTDLVPATPLRLATVCPGRRPDTFRHSQTVYTWLDGEKQSLPIEVTGGLIPHYRDRGNVHFALYAAAEATLDPVDTDRSVPPDGVARTITLISPYAGLHRLDWSDGGDRTQVILPAERPFTLCSTIENPMRQQGQWSLCFYVPPRTRTVGGYATETTGAVLDADGNERFSFAGMPHADYFSIPVPPGKDGTLWTFSECTGSRMLMTVPPYLAPTPDDLLLPADLVPASELPLQQVTDDPVPGAGGLPVRVRTQTGPPP